MTQSQKNVIGFIILLCGISGLLWKCSRPEKSMDEARKDIRLARSSTWLGFQNFKRHDTEATALALKNAQKFARRARSRVPDWHPAIQGALSNEYIPGLRKLSRGMADQDVELLLEGSKMVTHFNGVMDAFEASEKKREMAEAKSREEVRKVIEEAESLLKESRDATELMECPSVLAALSYAADALRELEEGTGEGQRWLACQYLEGAKSLIPSAKEELAKRNSALARPFDQAFLSALNTLSDGATYNNTARLREGQDAMRQFYTKHVPRELWKDETEDEQSP